MLTYDQYSEVNLVHSLVLYDWATTTDMVRARDIFDLVAGEVGRPPDIATVLEEKKGRDYLYKNFVKRDVIHQKDWVEFGYLWKRKEDVLSDFAIEFHFVPGKFKRISVHIDEAAVDNFSKVNERIAELLVSAFQPIYGIGYTMPYYWGPRAFAEGTISTRFSTVDRTFYGVPEQMRKQSHAFSGVYLTDNDKRNLDHMLRDVFEINFLSKGHLDRQVKGKTLRGWIDENAFGTLQQLTPRCWRWNVPNEDIPEIRGALIEAGLTVVAE